jgi:phage tail-like protein
MTVEVGDAIAASLFEVQVNGVAIAQFKEASGLGIEISVIEHQENKAGGVPVLKKLPSSQKFNDVTLKRGMTKDAGWWEWMDQVQKGDIKNARREASILLLDYLHQPVLTFDLVFCWPSKITVGALQAGATEVAIEEVTIVHEGLTVKAA